MVYLKVKVVGAGSIGNHMSHAARTLGWSVDLCDVDHAALERTRTQIYPSRYGSWDASIRLFANADAPRSGYDLIVIGTPPDSHVPLALEAITQRPAAVLVEKPFCGPGLEDAQRVVDAAREAGVLVFTGYDHVVGEATQCLDDVIRGGSLGALTTLDVDFREHWGGIFAAHPWLSGPADTYLGFWRRGGGASGEHSHATNLWQHLAHVAGAGRVIEVQAMLDFVTTPEHDYDRLCCLNLRTERGMAGRVVQDVVTRPPRKWARVQGTDGAAEWHCGYRAGVDAVVVMGAGTDRDERAFAKTRPDDFIRELRHVAQCMSARADDSPISIERGLDTMLVVAAAHKSVVERRTVRIDYSVGYVPGALT
jgi:predicted dehydrogenase